MKYKHYVQRGFSSSVLNLALQFRAWIFAKVGIQSTATPPSDYELVYEDRFDSKKLSSDWRIAQPWGFFHPKQLYWYWTEKVVKPTTKGLILENRHLPLTVYKKDLPKWVQSNDLPDEFILPWASGLISSKKTFKFGWIEAEIMLPREEMQWSAFWTSGSETWPPEIDIFEAYTDQDVEDIKVQPNIHYKLDDKGAKTDYGAPTIAVRKPADRFVKYAVHWTADFIKFYYDGLLVQVSTNHQALKDNAAEQYIILNNGLKWPTKLHHPTEGQMIVRNLKVFQKKNVTELDK